MIPFDLLIKKLTKFIILQCVIIPFCCPGLVCQSGVCQVPQPAIVVQPCYNCTYSQQNYNNLTIP